ncbi:hypothetical protein [Mesobacillus sp.]|uniref:hypothetical protein n=1 Tax=Mesobacillus sp. TaxID=2675271 RepID=UPI0039EF037D
MKENSISTKFVYGSLIFLFIMLSFIISTSILIEISKIIELPKGVYLFGTLALVITLTIFEFKLYKWLEDILLGKQVVPERIKKLVDLDDFRPTQLYEPVQRVTMMFSVLIMITGVYLMWYSRQYYGQDVNFISILSAGFTVFSVGMALALMAESNGKEIVRELRAKIEKQPEDKKEAVVVESVADICKDEIIIKLLESLDKSNEIIMELVDKLNYPEQTRDSDKSISINVVNKVSRQHNKNKIRNYRK